VLADEGATGDVYIEHRQDLELRARDGALEGLSRAEVRGLAVRAMKGGRLGFVHTTELDEEGVAAAARRACALSSSASERDDLVLAEVKAPAPPPREFATSVDPAASMEDEGRSLSIHDDALHEKPIEERVSWLVTAERAARGTDPRVRRTESAAYTESARSIWIANTNGLDRHYRRSTLSPTLEVVAENEGEKQIGSVSIQVPHWHALPNPAEFGRRAARKALRLLGGQPVRTGKYAVIMSPDAGWAPLSYLATALDGNALDRGRSWLSGRPSPSIGSPLVTIHDNGRLRGGPGSAPFDGEGVDTQDTVLMARGAITGKQLDLATSARTGTPPTGNATRPDYQSLPEIQSHNLYMEAGASTPEEIIASTKAGLWVWSLSGWWIGLDPSNPQFSSAAAGVWIEWGKLVKPVAQVTIASSVADLFKNIDAVGNDLVFDATAKTPTYRIAEMSISGT